MIEALHVDSKYKVHATSSKQWKQTHQQIKQRNTMNMPQFQSAEHAMTIGELKAILDDLPESAYDQPVYITDQDVNHFYVGNASAYDGSQPVSEDNQFGIDVLQD